jgi:hypothetical protein
MSCGLSRELTENARASTKRKPEDIIKKDFFIGYFHHNCKKEDVCRCPPMRIPGCCCKLLMT